MGGSREGGFEKNCSSRVAEEIHDRDSGGRLWRVLKHTTIYKKMDNEIGVSQL